MNLKHVFAFVTAITSLAATAGAADDANTIDPAYQHASRAAFEKWRDLKFGLRIHWGVYTLKGIEASWPLLKMSNAQRAEYQTLYNRFDPAHFDDRSGSTESDRLAAICDSRFDAGRVWIELEVRRESDSFPARSRYT